MQLVEIQLADGAKTYINPIHVVSISAPKAGDTEIHLDQPAHGGGHLIIRTKEAPDAVQARISNGLKNQ